ncbi:MAG: hypothetical protein RL199_255 [Pseudomonadota bacterium]|jgi:hypothetical protein
MAFGRRTSTHRTNDLVALALAAGPSQAVPSVTGLHSRGLSPGVVAQDLEVSVASDGDGPVDAGIEVDGRRGRRCAVARAFGRCAPPEACGASPQPEDGGDGGLDGTAATP